ncbi:branched-chain amino acid ABC transporter permease [Rhizobium sp. Leaf262]|uniref:branched-chain amino acid ABC transporter permease n=1 Tax=Rhizobium sp. Leaf262 TaxID=1736312 RepID=UPI00071314F7|nr:branched-chain amino acid ABC transporter permease [Rhizobium sp. Leaf262]KQO77502.1 ABC transporter permease [Rhizobium sp. Leaf262]
MFWMNAIVQGILLGGLYALFAAGLSLIFGVMRLVNIAHGDLIVLAAYIALVVVQATGLHPLVSALLVVPIMAVIGYLLQRFLLNPVLGKDVLSPLLVTFGISVLLQNGLLLGFTADSQRLSAGTLETASLDILPGLTVGILPLLMFVVSIVVIFCLDRVFFHTSLGRAFRATSDDGEVAQLMMIDRRHITSMAMALSLGVVAIAGIFLAIRTNFDPASGPTRLIFGFEAVIIGGLGNLWGTLAGGVVLGVAQAIGAQISPGWQILAGHIVFFIILAVSPRGLFPKMD